MKTNKLFSFLLVFLIVAISISIYAVKHQTARKHSTVATGRSTWTAFVLGVRKEAVNKKISAPTADKYLLPLLANPPTSHHKKESSLDYSLALQDNIESPLIGDTASQNPGNEDSSLPVTQNFPVKAEIVLALQLAENSSAKSAPAGKSAVFKEDGRLNGARVAHLIKVRHQIFNTLDFTRFINDLVDKERLDGIVTEYQNNRDTLFQIFTAYHVQPGVILALWGLESNFGTDPGSFQLIQALALQAYDSAHPAFYRSQLIDALQMLDQQIVFPQMLLSSFDGGMGQPQFIPFTYLHYAIDFTHKGFSDIWLTKPDILASIANYLHRNGWNGTQSWGMEVKIPKDFPLNVVGLHIKQPISQWKALGVTQLDGTALKDQDIIASLLLPAGAEGPAYLVYPNFRVLLTWNRSTNEAIAAGMLWNHCACDF